MIKYNALEKISEYGQYCLSESYGFGKIYIHFNYKDDYIEINFQKNKSQVILNEMSDLMRYLSSTKEIEENSKYIRKIKNTISQYIANCIVSNPNSSSSIQQKIETICGTDDMSLMKDLVHDFKQCINNYILNKRELILKEMFYERIQYSMTHRAFKELKTCSSKTMDYYVIPLDGDIFTNDVRNMMIVKSCRSNLYCDIVNETLSRIREKIIVPPSSIKYFQLDKVLTEEMIPFV
jgi:hypothetical protein